VVPGGPRPSYEELAALVVVQAEQIAELRAEVVELRRQLGQNSRTSSKPPSDSPFVKPAPRSLRGARCAARAAANRAGRKVIRVRRWRRSASRMRRCGARVIEHRLIARRCVCGITTCGNAPEGVTAPEQYGPRITAIILYLYVGQFLSKKRTAARDG
jgi:transposase